MSFRLKNDRNGNQRFEPKAEISMYQMTIRRMTSPRLETKIPVSPLRSLSPKDALNKTSMVPARNGSISLVHKDIRQQKTANDSLYTPSEKALNLGTSWLTKRNSLDNYNNFARRVSGPSVDTTEKPKDKSSIRENTTQPHPSKKFLLQKAYHGITTTRDTTDNSQSYTSTNCDDKSTKLSQNDQSHSSLTKNGSTSRNKPINSKTKEAKSNPKINKNSFLSVITDGSENKKSMDSSSPSKDSIKVTKYDRLLISNLDDSKEGSKKSADQPQQKIKQNKPTTKEQKIKKNLETYYNLKDEEAKKFIKKNIARIKIDDEITYQNENPLIRVSSTINWIFDEYYSILNDYFISDEIMVDLRKKLAQSIGIGDKLSKEKFEKFCGKSLRKSVEDYVKQHLKSNKYEEMITKLNVDKKTFEDPAKNKKYKKLVELFEKNAKALSENYEAMIIKKIDKLENRLDEIQRVIINLK